MVRRPPYSCPCIKAPEVQVKVVPLSVAKISPMLKVPYSTTLWKVQHARRGCLCNGRVVKS